MRGVTNLYPQRSLKQFVPQKSGLHRQAVFALYRAILSQCKAVPFDEADQNALQNVARNRFRANRHLRVPRRIKLSFYAGYKALDHLDDAISGEPNSVKRIQDILLKVPEHLKRAPEVKSPPPKRDDPPYETPEEHKLFNNFPRETVKGVRKVPFFVRANGFPMIRYKKPQPYQVTRALKGLIEGKQTNIDYQNDYEEVYLSMAHNEDKWDDSIRAHGGQETEEDETSFTLNAMQGLSVIKEISRERHRRTMEKAFKMVEIVEKEQELANQERIARSSDKQA